MSYSIKNLRSKLRTFFMGFKIVPCVCTKDNILQILREYAV